MSHVRLRGIFTPPFLNLAIGEMQETSHWPTYHWNVMSEQRKSNWQHPKTHYRERKDTPGTDECDTLLLSSFWCKATHRCRSQ
jgi:hypothetical protein